MTNSPHDAADIAARLHRLTGLNQTQIDSLSLSLDPVQVDQISDSLLATLVNGTLPGLPVNPAGGLPLGLPGATSAVRWVGGTASAAPTSGAFLVGDWVVGQNGTFWVCTTAGSPGTWTQATGGGGGGAVSSVAGKTGAVSLVKADVGLGNVDNTADASKPVSTAQASAIAGVLPAQTGQAGKILSTDGSAVSWTAAGGGGAVSSVAGKTGVVTLVKGDVGLGNVDNTADTAKPVSTAQAAADALALAKASNLSDLASASAARTNLGLGTAATQATSAFDAAGAAAATLPTPTAVKTSAYTAAAGDFVPVDTTSGAVTVTLPSAPADKTVIGVKHVVQGGTNAVTIARAGSDVFNKTGGSTSLSLPTVNQTMLLQYQSSTGIWYVRDSLSLAALDSRFAAAGAGGGTYPSGPLIKKGVYIPSGWGSTWRTARAAHASASAEAVVFGDSTTWGASTTAGSEVFSWVSWLRRLSIAAGFTDGGRGIVYNDYPDTLADQALPTTDSGKAVLSAPTGFAASLPAGAVTPGAASSTTASDSITFTGKGTAIRVHYTSGSTTGQFTYSVDGGTAVTVNPYQTVSLSAGTVYVGGLTEGTHTVTIVNSGSIPVPPPTTSFPNRTATGGGSLAAGTYYYVVTGTNASGETLQSSVITGTSGAGGQIALTMNTLNAALTGIKVYRTANGAGSSSGPFGLLGTSATVNFTDTGGTAPTMGTNPPVTNTAGNDTTIKSVGVNVDFFRSAGIVFHKQATSGISAGSYFGTSTTVLAPNAQVALGLTPGIGGPGGSYDWGTAKLAGPNNRVPALAVWCLGINDLQGLSIASQGTPTTTESDTATRQVALVENYVAHFVRMAKEAGADPLVIVPHFDLAQNAHTWGGQFIRAVWSAGVANSCAVVDFNEAIRPVGTMATRGLGAPGVHAEANTYKAEAQFLWDNCLSL